MFFDPKFVLLVITDFLGSFFGMTSSLSYIALRFHFFAPYTDLCNHIEIYEACVHPKPCIFA